MSTERLLLVLGNQLFPPDRLPDDVGVFLAEDLGLCTYVRHHQQKIVLFLSAMREYADELREAGYDVRYESLDPEESRDYTARLAAALDATGANELLHFEIEDRPMEARIIEFCRQRGLERTELRSPMFFTARDDFADFAGDAETLTMADFYRRQRRTLGVLVDADGKPEGGKWSFDADNRRKLPASVDPPEWPDVARRDHARDVIRIVSENFAGHPGSADDFRWPTTRREARDWLDAFAAQRLECFGPYEDAVSKRSVGVFHSMLSPLLNTGLLLPDEVLACVLDAAAEHDVPLQSTEGFVRQLIGWREFVRGIYRVYDERQSTANFWQHERSLTDAWYTGETGIPILDDTINTALEYGWTHHIPRLMVAGNLMTLCEIEPKQAWRWFMEMYVDSSEWVMGPNVFGMALFSDGGIFATKPYICGSNYLRKMSDYGKGDWCDTVDGLYWRFIDRHRDFFEEQPRLALMPKALDRLSDERRGRIFDAAEEFLAAMTSC
jgi:deoxyribodipyrimidine photolyase-related protein